MSSGSAATIDDVLAEVRELRRRVDELLRPAPKLLSRRAAARMLGVDRGTTLAGLIARGALRLVEGKIPLPDVERLVTEGVPAEPRRAKRTQPQKEAPDAIAAIRIDDL
jgi:hypothetical protein